MMSNTKTNVIIQGDALKILQGMESDSIDCVVTSPPYWNLRDYGIKGQIGLERNFEEYIQKLADVFDEVKRVLKPEGSCWVNLADTYSNETSGGHRGGNSTLNGKLPPTSASPTYRGKQSLPRKCLAQIPARFAIEMTNRGWILRNEIIWHKPNCMPASVTDRFTVDYEKLFFFTKNKKYYFEKQTEPLAEVTKQRYKRARGVTKNTDGAPGQRKHSLHQPRPRDPEREVPDTRNMRSVWKISTIPFKGAHFATFPPALITPPIKASCPPGGIVLDPFAGAGTTLMVAKKLKCRYIGIEISKKFVAMARDRIKNQS